MERTLGDRLIWLLTTILFCSFLIFETNSYISYILLGITSLIFLIIVFKYQFKFPLAIDEFQRNILYFVVFCGISSIWAIESFAAISKAVTIFEIMVCMSVLYAHYSKKKSTFELLECIKWAGYILTIYSIAFYGMDTIRATLASEGRIDNAYSNVNAIAMLAAISLVITVFKCLYYKISFSIIFSVPEIVLIAASGSRKALLSVGIGIILIAMFRYTSRNVFKTIFRYIGLIIIALFVVKIVLFLPMFTGINERIEGMWAVFTGLGKVEHSALIRKQYIMAGLEQFKNTPILGIGIANSHYILQAAFGKNTYLHNNFVEMLTCGGVVGFCLYYYMNLWPFFKLWKYRKEDDPCIHMVMILIIVLLIMDYGMVSYYSKTTYFYIMIYYLQARILKNHSLERESKCIE
jgi:O-antigen ligase